MSRLPIRVRLTLPFALAMALVLAALGAFVYVRVGATLLEATDQALTVATAEATHRIGAGRPVIDRDAEAAGSVAQVFAAGGALVASDPVGFPRLLAARALRSLRGGRSLHETVALPRLAQWRVFALRVRLHGRGEVIVLAGSLRDRSESLDRLRDELLFASPLALLVATLAGYLLAGAALRPVEAMRRKANAISAATPGLRLPVPASRDEVSRLAETLNEMLGRLETAFEHERLFIAEASHELRTPLALLRTELELALRRPRSKAELERALRSAAEETERLTALAANLLLLARTDESASALHREAIAAAELLAAVAERFAARAEALGRSVRVEPGAHVLVEADAPSVEQAVGNLLDNALVHGAGTVTLAARAERGGLALHVVDQGEGFAPGFAARAFDRFSRAEDARRRPGSGLGLAIVQAVAAAHGGVTGIAALLPAAPTCGSGSRFALTPGPACRPAPGRTAPLPPNAARAPRRARRRVRAASSRWCDRLTALSSPDCCTCAMGVEPDASATGAGGERGSRAAAWHRLGGARGNARLTSLTAAVLLLLLAVEGATIPAIHRLLSLHVFVGMLLLGPLALKLGSTGYRVFGYYARRGEYRRLGPPAPLMRFLVAPSLVLSTLVLFGSGVALLADPRRGSVLTLHKASFVVWFGAMSVHVLAYVLRVGRTLVAELGQRLDGRACRVALLVLALAAGVATAWATYPLAAPWLHGGVG